MKRLVGDNRNSQEKMRVPKEYRIKRSYCRKTAIRKNLINLEKLVRRNCVIMMCYLLFTDTRVQSVEILHEMENCGAGG
jgi:hypothetical protein